MKPSELPHFRQLPDCIRAYRSHRPGETDWISYTTDPKVATRFDAMRQGTTAAFSVLKSNVLAYFTRRGESELVMLDLRKAAGVCHVG